MLLLAGLLIVGAAFAQPVDYRIAAGGENRIRLEVDKTGIWKGRKHQFEFPNFEGKMTFDKQTPANSKVDLKIDAASITCSDTWLSEKDRKKVLDFTLNEFLAVRQYPDIRFTSSKVTAQGGNRYLVEGTLTIRGIGKPASLEATLDAAGPVVDGKSTVKMTNYGLKPPSAALGAIGTRDEMLALFHVTAAR